MRGGNATQFPKRGFQLNRNNCWLLLTAGVFFWNCGAGRPEPDTSLLEQTDVFVGGQDGVAEYRIPVLLTSTKGTLLAFCDARVKRPGDPANNIDLVMKRSFDRGRTWEPLRVLLDVGDGATADSCGLVDRQTGTIWVFTVYCPVGIGSGNAAAGLSGDTFMYWAIKSEDDGDTWSEPIDITSMIKKPEWTAGSPGPGKGIQTRSGRLIVPKYFSTSTQDYDVSHVVYSDDHGQTWQLGGETANQGSTNECQLAELGDGTLLLNMRGVTGNHRRIARSGDGGLTWSEVAEDPALIEPRCQASLSYFTDAVRHDKDRLLFSNPASTERKNMTVRLSYDGGRTWPVAKPLHAGPSAYSCLSVLPDLTIGCLYERGDEAPLVSNETHSNYQKITFARFNLDWLTDGKDRIPQE